MLDHKKKKFNLKNITPTQILTYRLPWAGRVSILHRASGILLFLSLPFLLYLFELSLISKIAYEKLEIFLNQPISKVVFLILIWAYFHHFCAGIRYLLLDLHVGIEKLSAKYSAIFVLILSLGLTGLVAFRMT